MRHLSQNLRMIRDSRRRANRITMVMKIVILLATVMIVQTGTGMQTETITVTQAFMQMIVSLMLIIPSSLVFRWVESYKRRLDATENDYKNIIKSNRDAALKLLEFGQL